MSIKNRATVIFAALALFLTAACKQQQTNVAAEYAPSAADITLSFMPMNARLVMGGTVSFIPRFTYVKPDGSAGIARLQVTNLVLKLDGTAVFDRPNSNWTQYDLLPYSNGPHVFEAEAVTAAGDVYRYATNITVSNVNVTFRAHLRIPLPAERKLYMAGNTTSLGIIDNEYQPTGLLMHKLDDLTYEGTIRAGMYEIVKYEVTMGNWALKAYDSNNTYIQGQAKVTQPNQVVDYRIDNFGICKGTISARSFIAGVTGDGSKFTVNYIRKTTNAVTLYWSYDGTDFTPTRPLSGNFCLFTVPALYGHTLKFYFSGETVTNSIVVPYNNVPFQFVAFGDSHGLDSATIRHIAAAEHPAFVIDMGDLVYDGYLSTDWDNFLNHTRPVLSKFLFQPEAGNHDAESPWWTQVTGKPWWYSFTWANCYFIAVDNSAPFEPGTTQYKWIETELKKAAHYPFIIVYLHYSAYNTRRHGCDVPTQTVLIPLFEKYKVDVVLSGHNHGYEATWPLTHGVRDDAHGIVYCTSAGGGATLYDSTSHPDWLRFEAKKYNYLRVSVENRQMTFEAVDENGNVFDSFVIKG